MNHGSAQVKYRFIRFYRERFSWNCPCGYRFREVILKTGDTKTCKECATMFRIARDSLGNLRAIEELQKVP